MPIGVLDFATYKFSLSSAIVKIAVTNKTLVKTNISTITFCYDWHTEIKTFDPTMPIGVLDFATYIIKFATLSEISNLHPI